MNWFHIHWYKVTFRGPIAVYDGPVMSGLHKKQKKCRCGAMKTRIRGGW